MKRKYYLAIIISIGLWLIFPIKGGEKVFGANFPEKPIKVIVPFGPGAGVDTEARGIVPYVEKHIGTKVIIENVSGADGKIGLTKVWRAKPDGYTLVIHTTTMSLIGEALFDPEYRILDFSRIFSWTLFNQVLVVNSEEWKTLDEFVKTGHTRPLSVGMPGRGSASHLMGLILVDGLGIKSNWVPFDGGPQAITALAGKHIDFATVATTTALPLVKAGKLRPLLVLGDQKDYIFPGIPLAKELGYKFPVIPAIRGVDGPPQMGLPIIKIIEGAFAKAIKEQGYITWAQKRMVDIVPLNHEEYQKAIETQKKEVEKYKGLLRGEK